MATKSDKEESSQYRLRQAEESSEIEVRGGSKSRVKSPVSTVFMIIGIIVFLMAFEVVEWGKSLDQNPLAIIAIFGTLGLMGLGASFSLLRLSLRFGSASRGIKTTGVMLRIIRE